MANRNPTSHSVEKDTGYTSAKNVSQKETKLKRKKRLEHDGINKTSEEISSQAH